MKIAWLFAAVLLIHSVGVGQESRQPSAAVGSALSTIFSPVHAPERKTMGLLQRSFVDMATQIDQPLEVAIVVDGTESMANELGGVRDSVHQMLADLRLSRGEVRVAIVIYRDAGSPSGETSLILKKFSTDTNEIADAVTKLVPESGQPFFHELADVGLQTALNELPWSEDPLTTRWILWFADAPPYGDSFNDPNYPLARRRFSTELLITVAGRKQVQINGVLCKSGTDVGDAYEKTVDATRSFMNELVTGTGGLMLDLSYEDIRSALVEAGKRPVVSYSDIAAITAEDIAVVTGQHGEVDSKTVQIAVLPYQPLAQVSFDPQLDTVQIATAIRHRLEQIPGVRLKSPVDVRRQLLRLRAEGLPESEQLRGIAARLGVDFVVWGQIESRANVQTAAYRRSDGLPAITVASESNPERVAEVFIQAAGRATETTDQPLDGFQILARRIIESDQQGAVQGPIAGSAAVQSELLSALESLQQAVAHQAGSDTANELLNVAEQSVLSAIGSERRNALAHWLAANIAMNRAAALWASGNSESAAQEMAMVRSSLRTAKEEGRRGLSASLQMEIEADEALLVQRDYVSAIAKYGLLAADSQPLASQLRAHWMLTGLHAGDWGASEWAAANGEKSAEAATLIDAKQVRIHALEILARWPDSPQADLLRRWLRWDPAKQRTQFHHFPLSNGELVKLDRE